MTLISLASGVVPECTPVETVEAAHQGGWDGVGLWIEPDKFDAQMMRDTKAALAASGLPVIDVEVVWFKPGPADPDHLRILDIGAEVGAKHVLCVSSDPDMGANAAKLNALCAHARQNQGDAAMRVCLEFGVFTEVKTLAAALATVQAADDPLMGMLIDPIHLNRSGGSAADVAALDPQLMPYAQFCDAPLPGPGISNIEAVLADAIDGRAQLGEGDLPLADIFAALPSDIALSIELRSKALRDGWPDTVSRAKVTADKTRAWINAHS